MTRFPAAAFGSAMVLAAGVGSAFAADLPGPAPVPPPQAPAVYTPAPPSFSWTGLYIGGNAGWGWSNGSGNFTLGGPTVAGTPDSFSASGNGFVGGGQIGGNYQYGNAVFGLEADFQGTSGSGTLTDSLAKINATAKDPWFGTFRGRLGYAWDRVLLYGTAGGVYGNSTVSGTSAPATGAPVTSFSTSATYLTWTAGAGIEAAFWGPLSAKIEYLYVGTPSATPGIPNVAGVSGTARTSIVRAGLNYHF